MKKESSSPVKVNKESSSDLPLYQCEFCDLEFVELKSARNHNYKHHKKDGHYQTFHKRKAEPKELSLYQCEFCDLEFVELKSARMHNYRHHRKDGHYQPFHKKKPSMIFKAFQK